MSIDPEPWQQPLSALLLQCVTRSLHVGAVQSIVQRWLRENEVSDRDAQDELAAACIAVLASPSLSARGQAVLRDSVLPLITSAAAWTHLLWVLHDSAPDSHTTHNLLLAATAPHGGFPSPVHIPSSITRPSPPRHTASSSSIEGPLPALTLLQPLLQQCVLSLDNQVSASSDLIGLLSLIIPHIDLQSAGGLTLDTVEQIMTLLPAMPTRLSQTLSAYLQAVLPLIDPRAPTVAAGTLRQPDLMEVDTTQDTQALPRFSRGKLPSRMEDVSVDKVVSLWLAHLQYELLHGASHASTSDDGETATEATESEKRLVSIGSLLPPYDAEQCTVALVASAFRLVQQASTDEERVVAWQLFTVRMPRLLQWWSPLESVLRIVCTEDVAAESRLVRDKLINTLDELRQGAEIEEEGCTSLLPDSSSIEDPMAAFGQRLVQLALLSAEELRRVLPESGTSAPPSLISVDQIASTSARAIPVLAQLVAYSSETSRQLGPALQACFLQLPTTPPPEGLFLNLAASPTLLVWLGTATSPREVLRSLSSHFFDRPNDVSSRAEDPQGSLTRFGEAVIFTTAFAQTLDFELPPVSQATRHNLSYAVLPAAEQSLVSGWLKALFGSDGIDDQILLATSHTDLCRLMPCVIQQAISAVVADQIDLDVLNSGVSYFSQPLLSWSLGGLAHSLCAEARRNGALSALHLVVLQNLLLNEAFPVPLLRAVARQVQDVLDASAGLGPVIASSGFDVAAVQAKFTSSGIPFPTVPSQDQGLDPLMALQLALQNIFTGPMAPPVPVEDWQRGAIVALANAERQVGPEAVAAAIVEHALERSSSVDAGIAWTVTLLVMSDTFGLFLHDTLRRYLGPTSQIGAEAARTAYILATATRLGIVSASSTPQGASDAVADVLHLLQVYSPQDRKANTGSTGMTTRRIFREHVENDERLLSVLRSPLRSHA